jgi:DNA-binding response OmpR family regulator
MAKILIVDDDPDVVDAVRTVLESEGHDVSAAHSRADGLKILDGTHPDLLILDIMMDQPDDGIAMAQELRKKDFGKPILMMSSISRVTGMEYGKDQDVTPVDAFVEKPVKPQDLVARVQELLDGK